MYAMQLQTNSLSTFYFIGSANETVSNIEKNGTQTYKQANQGVLGLSFPWSIFSGSVRCCKMTSEIICLIDQYDVNCMQNSRYKNQQYIIYQSNENSAVDQWTPKNKYINK